MSGGEQIGFNHDVFMSEREAADRNFALGFYMREHKCFPKDSNLQDCLDLYFQVFLNYYIHLYTSIFENLIPKPSAAPWNRLVSPCP